MNKVTLPCLKSLVEFRPKGDWNFLTKLTLLWPDAKHYYWDKQGFKVLLGSWPFPIEDPENREILRFWLVLPEGKVLHGLSIEVTCLSMFARIFDHGEELLTLVYPFPTPSGLSQWNEQDLEVWVDEPLTLDPKALEQLYKESPQVKQKVLRALNLVKDQSLFGIRALDTLASLTCKA